jgi:hypothetical protein
LRLAAHQLLQMQMQQPALQAFMHHLQERTNSSCQVVLLLAGLAHAAWAGASAQTWVKVTKVLAIKVRKQLAKEQMRGRLWVLSRVLQRNYSSFRTSWPAHPAAAMLLALQTAAAAVTGCLVTWPPSCAACSVLWGACCTTSPTATRGTWT